MNPLHPVLAPFDAELRGRAGVTAARDAATAARVYSARAAGLPAGPFERDPEGAPRAAHGSSWSTAHTTGLAVGLVSAAPVGVDVERIDRPRLEALRESVSDEELALLGGDDPARLLGLWTCKEAVLKLAGCGLAELSACRLASPLAADRGLFTHRGREHHVHRHAFGPFVLALACGVECVPTWHLLTAAPARPEGAR